MRHYCVGGFENLFCLWHLENPPGTRHKIFRSYVAIPEEGRNNLDNSCNYFLIHVFNIRNGSITIGPLCGLAKGDLGFGCRCGFSTGKPKGFAGHQDKSDRTKFVTQIFRPFGKAAFYFPQTTNTCLTCRLSVTLQEFFSDIERRNF